MPVGEVANPLQRPVLHVCHLNTQLDFARGWSFGGHQAEFERDERGKIHHTSRLHLEYSICVILLRRRPPNIQRLLRVHVAVCPRPTLDPPSLHEALQRTHQEGK